MSFYSNGKLLITGEYLVLYGAQALALPLKLGQSLKITEAPDKQHLITWNATDTNGKWFEALITIDNFKVLHTSDSDKSAYLVHCLKMAKGLNPSFLNNNKSIIADNHCTFDINWGFGSSSTFLSNLAYWADIDPFQLHSATSNGSGYDIACARSSTPVLYTLQKGTGSVIEAVFNPPYINKIFLVYTEKKQTTSSNIEKFKSIYVPNDHVIAEVSKLSIDICKSDNLDDFMELILKHEDIIAKVLSEQPLKEKLFSDFDGVVKSLGAWGGDFMMAVSKKSEYDVLNYFKNKGYRTIIPMKDLILKP
jgi:mevalonate kinase